MMFQISRRGREYLETARTLLRAAQTMTDRAVAGQLKALADDYERRAEKAAHGARPVHPILGPHHFVEWPLRADCVEEVCELALRERTMRPAPGPTLSEVEMSPTRTILG